MDRSSAAQDRGRDGNLNHAPSGAAGAIPAPGHGESAAQGRRAAAYVPCPSHDLLVAVDAKGKLIGSCPGCVAEAAAGVKRLNGRARYRNLQARKGMERS